jgi:predicted TIM-barrel fold metal-dependent hydrolase
LYVDTSSSLPFLTAEEGQGLIRSYGADKVLFGTDYPMWDPKAEFERFFALGLTEEENRKILSGNVIKLFNM